MSFLSVFLYFLFFFVFLFSTFCLASLGGKTVYYYTMTGVIEPSNQGGTEKNETQVTFNEQTNYVPKRTIITVSTTEGKNNNIFQLLTLTKIFLACSSVDLLALMDQTTLAASLSIIGNALGASDQTSWISGGYFVSVYC